MGKKNHPKSYYFLALIFATSNYYDWEDLEEVETCGKCIETQATVDAAGDGCEWYRQYTGNCDGTWDIEDFTASNCCDCGGGKLVGQIYSENDVWIGTWDWVSNSGESSVIRKNSKGALTLENPGAA